MKAIKQISKGILLFFALFVLLGATARAQRERNADEPSRLSFSLCENAEQDTTYYIKEMQDAFVALDAKNTPYAERASLTELLSALPTGHLVFQGVTSDEPLTLNRSFSFAGELTVPTLRIEGGASVSMQGGRLWGELAVRNGSFLLFDGEIACEQGSAVTLDYMASALFHMLGGAVRSSEAAPTIFVGVGSALIGGGAVENTHGAAIACSATLTLYGAAEISGKNFDIESTRAVHLSYGDYPFSGRVSIRTDTTYNKGSFSVIAYGADAENASRITLFDSKGSSVALTYFSESAKTKERDVLAVALPYDISFCADGKEFERVSLYEGELILPPAPPQLSGYRFVGYLGEGGELAEGTVASSDAVFCADYELAAPTFSLSNLSFTYDGTSHVLSLENLSHPLMGEGYFSYTWYKNGETLAENAPSLSVKNVSQSGRYRVMVSFTYKTESVSVLSEEITLTVSPMTVAVPMAEDKIYDGTHLYATVTPSPYYAVKENGGGMAAGKYRLVLVLTDPKNTVWQEAEGDTIAVSFSITQAQNAWLSECWVKDAYLGKMPEFGGYARFGESTLEYAKSEEGPYSPVLPGTAGIYYVRVRVSECENYTELLSETVRIEIRENKVISIRIDSVPSKVKYTAFETVDLSGILVSATYLDGSVLPVDVRSLYVIYDTYTSYLAGTDSGVTLGFGDARARLLLDVSRARFDLSGFTFSDLTVPYCGTAIAITPGGSLPMGRDGAQLSYRIEGEGVDVGSYGIRLSFLCESKNYELPSDMTATLTITPKEVVLQWEMQTFIYDGTLKTPKASFISAFGNEESAIVSGGQIKSGESYLAVASEPSGNYIFTNPTHPFAIEKASYDLSGVYWSEQSFSYDGAPKEVLLLGLPAGVTVSAYTGNKATTAGEYTASATLSYDAENYFVPTVPSCSWRILRAVYDLSGFEAVAGSFVYDGNVHYPDTFGNLPTGHDGITPTFTFSGGVREVNEGKRTVEIVFHTESQNYETPKSLFVSVWITPAPVTVEWSGLSFTYDGDEHLPVAKHESISVSVVGGGVNAGEYVASATSNDPNFYVKNAKISFVIQKAKNHWLVPLSVKDIYTSGVPECSASAKYGSVSYLFYTADGAAAEAPESTAGEYYCVAIVEEGENYLALSSERCRFLVQEVLPCAIEATVREGACVAYRTLSPDALSVTLVHNDGSRLPLSDYAVTYQNGSSLRKRDTSLLVSYGDFSVSVPISVSPATLRAEDITLSQESGVYSGEAITLSVLSMPEGVSLLSLDAPLLCYAGEYEITLRFALDGENYEGDGVLVYHFVIEKQELIPPTLADSVYNGKTYTLPDFSESAFEISDATLGRLAGEYAVTFKVKDSENTCFGDGRDTVTVSYRITRSPLTVKLSDLTLYADGYYEMPTYEIISGSLCEGDILSFSPSVADTVGGVFENDNYEITVIEGSVIRSDMLSPEYRERAFLIFFAIVALVLLILLVVFRRRSIRAYFTKHLVRRTPSAAASTPAPETATSGERSVHGAESDPTTSGVAAAGMPSTVLRLPAPSVSSGAPIAESGASTPSVLPSLSNGSACAGSERAEQSDDDAFQLSFDFFEDGEKAVSGRMMDGEEHGANVTAPLSQGTDPSVQSAEDGGIAATLLAPPVSEVSTRLAGSPKTRQRKKRTKKSKKRAARVKKEQAESIFELLFAPWHRNAASHAERTVAHHCEDGEREAQAAPEAFFGICAEEADRLLSDRSAQSLLQSEQAPLVTYGRRRVLLYLDTIAEHFSEGERVDINALKSRAVIPYDTLYLKVLARGTLSKPLAVYASEFELCAVKMLLLTGGRAVKQKTKSAVSLPISHS